MENEMTDEEKWELLGYIKVSKIRLKTLTTLGTSGLIPKEIAKLTDYRTTEISNTLKDLKERELVECKTEQVRKGRIYKTTERGLIILQLLEENSP